MARFVVVVVSGAQRVKGRRAEREVALILEAHGFTVRGLEGGGDHVAVGHGVTLHVEVKRQERGFRTAWAAQARDEAPPGSLPVVIYRRSRAPWTVAVVGAAGWTCVPLTDWLAAL